MIPQIKNILYATDLSVMQKPLVTCLRRCDAIPC